MASIFFRTLIVFALLTVSMKLMGKRGVGELDVGELITTLLLSEICSIPIDDPDIPLLSAILPVILIVSLEVIISYLKNKSLRLKRLLDGEKNTLIKNGRLNQTLLRRNRISLEELFAAMRQNGIGRIADVESCVLEANGKISMLKNESGIDSIVISDGEINKKALDELGLSETALRSMLGGRKAEDVFLMTLTPDGECEIIDMEKTK
ncbi:MAG: DUF421 domain-containing protein [Ruminococcaceae bacterium]|nr:DUF421 domain-containing protein [Oscillospiraceae bacterium]